MCPNYIETSADAGLLSPMIRQEFRSQAILLKNTCTFKIWREIQNFVDEIEKSYEPRKLDLYLIHKISFFSI